MTKFDEVKNDLTNLLNELERERPIYEMYNALDLIHELTYQAAESLDDIRDYDGAESLRENTRMSELDILFNNVVALYNHYVD